MAFSMHSHSGQFCPGHAKDSLEEVVQRAIELKFRLFAFTEHMPRTNDEDLYPEEIQAQETISALLPRHEAYLTEAVRLRTKYAKTLPLLIGFEGEWIRGSSYLPLITSLLSNPAVDFFIASVHHVLGIPIDYDKSMFADAVAAAGGSETLLFEKYFDAQFEMLSLFREKGVGVGAGMGMGGKGMVVGHFDLIRLLAKEPDRRLREYGKGVWERVVRNLRAVREVDGLLEINSAALRKGLKEPYPQREVVEEFLNMGGKFTLSDDSHGIAHVGSHLQDAIEYLEEIGVRSLHHYERRDTADGDGSKSVLIIVSVPLGEMKSPKINGKHA